jgi:hypothetical protein
MTPAPEKKRKKKWSKRHSPTGMKSTDAMWARFPGSFGSRR